MDGIFPNSSIVDELDTWTKNLTYNPQNNVLRKDYVQFNSPVNFDPSNITFTSGTEYWAVKPVGEIGNYIFNILSMLDTQIYFLVWKSLLFLPVVSMSIIGNLLILYVLYR